MSTITATLAARPVAGRSVAGRSVAGRSVAGRSVAGSPDARQSAIRTHLRLTRRGRIVIMLLVAVPLIIGVALAVLNGGRATAGDTQAHVRFQTVTIEPGESLWQVAQDEAPNADPRDFVQDVVDLNNLSTSAVQAGQQVSIPTKYTAVR